MSLCCAPLHFLFPLLCVSHIQFEYQEEDILVNQILSAPRYVRTVGSFTVRSTELINHDEKPVCVKSA